MTTKQMPTKASNVYCSIMTLMTSYLYNDNLITDKYLKRLFLLLNSGNNLLKAGKTVTRRKALHTRNEMLKSLSSLLFEIK